MNEERLEAALAAVEALHVKCEETGKCKECTVAPYSMHSVHWPCPTASALTAALGGEMLRIESGGDGLGIAATALAAADSVMFSEDAVERAARAMFAEEQCDRRQKLDLESNWNGRLDDRDREEYRSLTRAVIEALRDSTA